MQLRKQNSNDCENVAPSLSVLCVNIRVGPLTKVYVEWNWRTLWIVRDHGGTFDVFSSLFS